MELESTENQTSAKGFKNPLTRVTMLWGLYFGAFVCAFSIILAVTGTYNAPFYFNVILFFGGLGLLTLGLRAYQKHYDGFFTYGRAVRAGTIISLYAAVVALILMTLTYYVLAPDYASGLYEISMAQIAARHPEGSEAYQIESAVMQMVCQPWVLTVTMVLNVFVYGFIAALITAIFEREKKQEA